IGAGATIAYNNQVADNGIVIAHGGIIELRAGGVIRDNFSDGSSSGVFLFGTNPTTANGYAYSSSIFLMSGGEIRNNETSSNSGGIGTSTVGRNHHIYMMGGVIRDNIAMNGGGVSISSHTTFMMEAGEISGNHATGEGGGVVVNNGGRFIMHSGARIVNNRAELDGGGIMFRVPATFYSALYANPLDPNIAGVFDTLDIRQGAIFYGNTARNWALPPTILPAVPPAIVVNQLNNVRWNAASDSSSVWLCTNEDCNNCTSTANQHTDCNGRYLYLLNNYDINFAPAPDPWFLGNIPTWPIYKTDMAIYNTTTFADRRYLPGAFFSLLVYNGTGTPPLGIITNDMIGPAANQWTYVTTLSSGTIGGPVGTPGIVPMRFPMLQGRVYQLEEIVPPTGFQPPYGQWRITIPAALGTASNPSARILENISTTVGGAPPVISRSRQVAGSPVYSNYIGNMSDFNLPLTGGEGSNLAAYAMAGTVVICMAFASFGVMKVVKGKKVRKG
ncbi:MAG: hypothetical protein FWC92_10255, partial [Defluviitaleaceae bacterium]|nr:hypothetical protein [Defluviitaleaceae bacterium]